MTEPDIAAPETKPLFRVETQVTFSHTKKYVRFVYADTPTQAQDKARATARVMAASDCKTTGAVSFQMHDTKPAQQVEIGEAAKEILR